MDDASAATTVAVAGCAVVLALLAAPYLLVAQAAAVTAYYGAGAVTPFATGLFALVGVIVFAAGREERSDPALTAGAGLVFALFMAVTGGLWALTVPSSVALQLGDVTGAAATFLEYHRHLVALAALAVLVAAGGYARALRLV